MYSGCMHGGAPCLHLGSKIPRGDKIFLFFYVMSWLTKWIKTLTLSSHNHSPLNSTPRKNVCARVNFWSTASYTAKLPCPRLVFLLQILSSLLPVNARIILIHQFLFLSMSKTKAPVTQTHHCDQSGGGKDQKLTRKTRRLDSFNSLFLNFGQIGNQSNLIK